jgi:hypothetical protein
LDGTFSHIKKRLSPSDFSQTAKNGLFIPGGQKGAFCPLYRFDKGNYQTT